MTIKDANEKIKEARKPKMRTVEQYLCDQCDKVIDKPENGFVVHGNIYVADPSCSGGLIGNNFPPCEEGEAVIIDKIKQTVMCKPCFLRAIGVTGTTNMEVGLDIDDVISGVGCRPSAGGVPSTIPSSKPKLQSIPSVSPYDAGARRGRRVT